MVICLFYFGRLFWSIRTGRRAACYVKKEGSPDRHYTEREKIAAATATTKLAGQNRKKKLHMKNCTSAKKLKNVRVVA